MRRHPPLALAALTALLLAPSAASADPALVPTKIEILRATDGARVLLKAPKTCRLIDAEVVATIKKSYEADPRMEHLAGYWCYLEVDGEELSGVIAVSYHRVSPPSAAEFNGACAMSLQPRLGWVKKHFGESEKIEVKDARCDAGRGRITLIGTSPETAPLDMGRMTILPGSKGVVFVNVILGRNTSESLRVPLEAIADSVSVRDAPSAAPPAAIRDK
jgi:hypothetical protein